MGRRAGVSGRGSYRSGYKRGVNPSALSIVTGTVARTLANLTLASADTPPITGTLNRTLAPLMVEINDVSLFLLPSQQEEQNTYDNVLNWIWTPTDKLTNFQFPAPASVSIFDIHGDTEGDELWNHYQQWKRTGLQVHFDWATIWRNYFVDNYWAAMTTTGDGAGHRDGVDFLFDHLYGWGLCLWGMERGDTAALAAAEVIATKVEELIAPMVPGVENMCSDGPRRDARKLLFSCYFAAANPIARWVNMRNKLIDLWVQSTGYEDTTNFTTFSPAISGGNYYAGRSHGIAAGIITGAEYDSGIRAFSSAQNSIVVEGLWLAYKQTGRADVRARIVEIAKWMLYYGHDPLHVNAMIGTYVGHFNGARWHKVGGTHTDPNTAPADCSHDTAQVNTLIYGYKLTSNVGMLTAAHDFLRQGTQYASIQTNSPKAVPDNQVHHYLDTVRQSSDPKYFYYGHGEVVNASCVFENSGVPVVENPWPYDVPSFAGEVVAIAGDVSSRPTNVWADVRPTEVGGPGNASLMLIGGDSAMQYIASYSRGGAVVQVGGGGHHGTVNFGGAVFDLEDGRWKRVWTGGTTVGNVDLRSGTRIHNCLNHEDDLVDKYSDAGGHGNFCAEPSHWTPTATERNNCPVTADPRDQTWEITRVEPTAATSPPPHSWPFPGEWAGLQQGLTGKSYGGFVGNSERFQPTPGMPMPAPSHCWDMYYEVTPANGGGPKGSIAACRHTAMGHANSIQMAWNWRFDLDAGTWHEFSTNASTGSTTAPPGGDPWTLNGVTAACLDPIRQRMYLLNQHNETGSRINYMNLSDRTWRNMSIGSGTTTTGRTESIACDPDRRLLIIGCQSGFPIRAFDLSTVVTEPIPAGGTGGFRSLPITAAPGFTVPAGYYNWPWVYYPPNGKLYRSNASPPVKPTQGQPMGTFDTLQRLTPPPLIANPPLNYYFTQPWTYDEITLSAPMARPSWFYLYSSVSAKAFFYVPVLECMIWVPLDAPSGEPVTRNPVYLIKPY